MRLGLQGGSGKTYSSLLLACGMASDWTKIAVIDTENGSADLYAHLGAYNVLSLSEPYNPEKYIDAIGICESAGMDMVSPFNHEQEYKIYSSTLKNSNYYYIIRK